MKIKQSELKKLEKQGVTVKRKMGAQPPRKEAAPPKKKAKKRDDAPAPHASMAASMEAASKQIEAANVIAARNSEIIKDFAENVKELQAQKSPFAEGATFDIVRDDDKLLKRVYARPGILEE